MERTGLRRGTTLGWLGDLFSRVSEFRGAGKLAVNFGGGLRCLGCS